MSTDQLDISLTQGQNDNKEEAGAEGVRAASQARLELVCTKLADPKFEAAELMRVITVEIASVVGSMLSLGFTAEELLIMSCLSERVKVLRALSKQLIDAALLRKKEDVVNFEGQAFQYVLDKVVELFVKAMKEARVEESLCHCVMLHYRDLMDINEPLIRRETRALEG
jgi:hypothetical protein